MSSKPARLRSSGMAKEFPEWPAPPSSLPAGAALASTPLMSALEPLPRLCAPRGSVRPPESICTAVIEHAARNGTQVLLSLLPLDLRIKVDRMHRIVAWHHAGELIIVPNVVIDDADRIPPTCSDLSLRAKKSSRSRKGCPVGMRCAPRCSDACFLSTSY